MWQEKLQKHGLTKQSLGITVALQTNHQMAIHQIYLNGFNW